MPGTEDESHNLTNPSSLSFDSHIVQGDWSDPIPDSFSPTVPLRQNEHTGWLGSPATMQSTFTPPSTVPTSTPATTTSQASSNSRSRSASRSVNDNMASLPVILPSGGSHTSTVPISRLQSHRCTICDERFGTLRGLDRHLASHEAKYRCEVAGCHEAFTTKRSRDRHYETQKHKDDRFFGPSAQTYRCRCGKSDSRSRKYNHLRHVNSCNSDATMLYQCFCGAHTAASKRDYVSHVRDCLVQKEQSNNPQTASSTKH